MKKTAVLVVAAAAPLVVAAAGAVPAEAGPPGSWTTVATQQTNTAEPGLLRTPDGVLHVVWQRDDGASESVWHTRIGKDGKVIDSTAVVTGWDTIQNAPRLIPIGGGGLRAVFSGIRDAGPPTEFHDLGRIYTAVSDGSGTSWTLPNEALSNDVFALETQPGADVLSDGTPVTAWASDGGFRWHDGTETNPDSSTDGDFSTGSCCSYGAAVAVDGDDAWASYYSNAGAEEGVWVAQFLPAPGQLIKAPHSTVSYHGQQEGVSQDHAQAFVAREGGGVFLAYLVGYPTADHVALWNVTTDKVVAVPRSKGATAVGLGSGPGGRLWVAWVDGKDDIRAVRTGTSGFGFGGVRVLPAPANDSYDVFVEGSAAKADVLVNTGTALKHQQLWPGMNLGAKPRAWPSGSGQKVVFSVADAGVPLGGAEVDASGKSCTTNAAGSCSITFPAGKPRKIVATVTHSGYADGKITLRAKG